MVRKVDFEISIFDPVGNPHLVRIKVRAVPEIEQHVVGQNQVPTQTSVVHLNNTESTLVNTRPALKVFYTYKGEGEAIYAAPAAEK